MQQNKTIPLIKRAFTFLSALFFISMAYGQTRTIISGQISNLKTDTIKILLQINSITRQTETFFVPVVNGRFEKEIQISKPTYLYATDGLNYINGLAEPGDRTNITYDAGNVVTSLKFQGKGSEKFTFLNTFIQYRLSKKLRERVPLAKETKYPFDQLFKFIDSAGTSFLNQLNLLKPSMGPESFKLLQADINASIIGNKYRSVGMVYHESIDETLQKRHAELTGNSKKYLQNILKFDKTLFYSSTYLNEVYNILFVHYDGLVLANKISAGILKKYNYLNQLLPGNLKTPVITLFLEHDISKLNQAEDLEVVINRTYLSAKDSIYKNYIAKRYSDAVSFKKGMNAPDFVLENEREEKVTLASFKGKIVYIDFWYGACGPCHALFQTIKSVKKHFSKNENVVFLCVSIDSKDTWEASLKKYKIDGYHVFTENMRSNHPIIKAYKVGGYPTACLIDKNGKILMANPSNNPDELLKQIETGLMIESN